MLPPYSLKRAAEVKGKEAAPPGAASLPLRKANRRVSFWSFAPVLMLVTVLTPATSRDGRIHLPSIANRITSASHLCNSLKRESDFWLDGAPGWTPTNGLLLKNLFEIRSKEQCHVFATVLCASPNCSLLPNELISLVH